MNLASLLWQGILAGVLLLCLPLESAAQSCLNLVSQNTLHYGYRQPRAGYVNKPTAFRDMLDGYASGGGIPYVMGMFQEVMRDSATQDVPNYPGYITGVRKGRGSYKEAYGFVPDRDITLVTGAKFAPVIWEYENINPGHAASFIRPPAAIFVSCTTPAVQNDNVWLINLHSIFGRTIGQRRYEAASMATVVTDYFNCAVNINNQTFCNVANSTAASAVIIGADWNLTDTDVDTQLCTPLRQAGLECAVHINVLTSINRAGNYSSSYDHWVEVYANGAAAPLSNYARLAPANYNMASLPNFRNTVSDHMGIFTNVR